MKRRIVAQMAILALSLSAPVLAVTHAPEAAAADGSTIHVSAEGGSDAGDGSAAKPFQTIKAALKKVGNGDTIELANGTYREGELAVDKGVTIKAAEGAKPVLTGAEVPTNWSAGGDGKWSTGKDMVRFCTVCTINADPAKEGVAAHPEQVFVDGKPLTQVLSRDEVTASTFYVDDPDPVTLKNPNNNQAGYNAKPHRGTSYVIGVDPSQHQVEVVQHSRALSFNTDNITLSGLTVEKYSAVQRWDYPDPEIGTISGGGMIVAAHGAPRIENSTFRYSSTAGALQVIDSTNAVVSNNLFESNGSNAFGINDSSGAKVENNLWRNNNTSGFITKDCGAYCTLADTKITHSKNIRFANNTVDYSATGVDISDPNAYDQNRGAGIWFDEGVMDSEIVGNYFVNVPVAIFNEVSANNLIASNIVAGAGIGIHVSGSNDTRVWNNTVSHALTSLWIQEDTRSDGCNARNAQGACTQVQKWSAEHGLSWDTTNTTVMNNIFSSEQTTPKPGDEWRYSAMVQVLGGANDDGSGAVYANEMVSTIDYDVYYRHENPQTLSTTVLWNYGADRKTQSVNAEKLSDFTANSNVKAAGKESNGLDLHGSPENNPFFVKESANPMDKTSDFHLKEGSPASGSGHALPEDVAKSLGVNANVAVDRGALVNVAWGGGAVPGAGDNAGNNNAGGANNNAGNNNAGGANNAGNNNAGGANNNAGNNNAGGANNNAGGANNNAGGANNNAGNNNAGGANNAGNNNGGGANNNAGNQPSAAAPQDGSGSTTGETASSTAGQSAQSASPSNSKAGAGQKNSHVAKPGANAAAGQGQDAAAAAAAGGGRLPLTGASMAAMVLAVAAIAMGGGFILVRRRMSS